MLYYYIVVFRSHFIRVGETAEAENEIQIYCTRIINSTLRLYIFTPSVRYARLSKTVYRRRLQRI